MKKPHLKHTILIRASDPTRSAASVEQAVISDNWDGLFVAATTVHTSNFHALGTRSGDILLAFSPEAGDEITAQPELQKLTTQIMRSGTVPRTLDQEIEKYAGPIARGRRRSGHGGSARTSRCHAGNAGGPAPRLTPEEVPLPTRRYATRCPPRDHPLATAPRDASRHQLQCVYILPPLEPRRRSKAICRRESAESAIV